MFDTGDDDRMDFSSSTSEEFSGAAVDARQGVGRSSVSNAVAPVPPHRLATTSGSDGVAYPMHLLICDRDPSVLRGSAEIATQMGFVVHTARNAALAENLLERLSVDVVLMDLRSGKSGVLTLESWRRRMPRIPIVVMTALGTVHSAVDAMRRGASDYLVKPFGLEELAATLHKAGQQREFDVESRRLREQLKSDPQLGGFFGMSAVMQKLLRMAAKVAVASHPVLIVGESGTGKQMLAAGIARAGSSGSVPSESELIVVDCARLSAALQEQELFGDSQSGQGEETMERPGILCRKEGGSLLLHSVSEMSLALQGKLLRAIQERQVRPEGGASAQPVTVRILASSSQDLAALVDKGLFRKDLYLRLNVVNLRIPPLREREEDIPVLAEFFLRRYSNERGFSMSFSAEVMRAVRTYSWPENVRELDVVVQRACSVSTGPFVHLADLPTQLQHVAADLDSMVRIDARRQMQPNTAFVQESTEREGIVSIAELERQAILDTLKKLNGDKLKAARLLGIGKTTLYRKLKEYGIEEE